MNDRQPDLCVGIDFGTTYTGVSWSTPKELSNDINLITQWPGEPKDEYKVPTALAKDASGGKTRWGFLCQELAEDKKWKYFKLLLDPNMYKKRFTDGEPESWVPESIGQVRQIATLYLRQVYTHLSNKIPELLRSGPTFSPQLRCKNWNSLAIDFVFSTPTTWQATVSQHFRGIISEAGFGEQKLHRAMLGLTEAEASAVFSCQPETVGKVQKGDVVLSIDAGGGTTDLAFVKAAADTAGSLALEEIRPVTGLSIGSVTIDIEFEKLIEERIERHSETQRELPRNLSVKVSQSKYFQSAKHKLGPKDSDQVENEYSVENATGKDSYSHEGLGIRDGSLYFTRQQLESCFDITLQKIKRLIEDALGNFETSNRRQGIVRHVNHIVLSGGLGSSDYVLDELTTYFKRLGNEANSCVTGSKVFRTKGDARTVVAKGLLYNRTTKARTLGEHKARGNYGIIVEEKIGKWSPLGENIKRYPGSDTKFATDRIRWLVKFGDTIQVGSPITTDITKRLVKSEQWKWTEKIVWLQGASSILPANVKDGLDQGVEELHSADIEVRPGEKLSRRFWQGFDQCDFKLALVVGPSGDCDVEVSGKVIKQSESEALKQ